MNPETSLKMVLFSLFKIAVYRNMVPSEASRARKPCARSCCGGRRGSPCPLPLPSRGRADALAAAPGDGGRGARLVPGKRARQSHRCARKRHVFGEPAAFGTALRKGTEKSHLGDALSNSTAGCKLLTARKVPTSSPGVSSLSPEPRFPEESRRSEAVSARKANDASPHGVF